MKFVDYGYAIEFSGTDKHIKQTHVRSHIFGLWNFEKAQAYDMLMAYVFFGSDRQAIRARQIVGDWQSEQTFPKNAYLVLSGNHGLTEGRTNLGVYAKMNEDRVIKYVFDILYTLYKRVNTEDLATLLMLMKKRGGSHHFDPIMCMLFMFNMIPRLPLVPNQRSVMCLPVMTVVTGGDYFNKKWDSARSSPSLRLPRFCQLSN